MPNADAPNTARISGSLSRPTVSSDDSNSNQFVTVALFSGLGLLASLIGILCGVLGGWY
jgi:hypothetical protein